MKWAILILVISILMILTAIGIAISDWQTEYVYTTSGEYLMTTPQWEQFKLDLFNDKFSDIKDVFYLDSGDTKVVSFNDMKVENNFKWGTITETKVRSPNGEATYLQALFTVFGGLGLIIILVLFIDKHIYGCP